MFYVVYDLYSCIKREQWDHLLDKVSSIKKKRKASEVPLSSIGDSVSEGLRLVRAGQAQVHPRVSLRVGQGEIVKDAVIRTGWVNSPGEEHTWFKINAELH